MSINYKIIENEKVLDNLKFFKINGLQNSWKQSENIHSFNFTADILASYFQNNIPFLFLLTGNSKGVSIYIGTLSTFTDSLKSLYCALYPGINIEMVENNPLNEVKNECGGIFHGFPTNKIENEQSLFQIETILNGMQGKNFTYLVVAQALSESRIELIHSEILNKLENVYSSIDSSVSGGVMSNITIQRKNYNKLKLHKQLEQVEEECYKGMNRGMWSVTGIYASDNIVDSNKLSNMIKSGFSGSDSPIKFKTEEFKKIIFEKLELLPQTQGSPCNNNSSELQEMFDKNYQTIMNSDMLSVLSHLPIKEYPGYYINDYIEFNVANRRNTFTKPVVLGDICTTVNTLNLGIENKYTMDLNDFTRHMLIIGMTGGGKTNTSKSILSELWNPSLNREKTPFLVIESAKREYWEMKNLDGFEDLVVFTLGNETNGSSVKYRINPFQVMPGVTIQTHIDYLMSTFKASFDLQPPMPYVLEQAVYAIYKDKGWDIVENTNKYGFSEYPTIQDLYNKVEVIVDGLGYHNEIESNVKAALKLRVSSLMTGGKGAVLNTRKSFPINELLSRPVVLELEDIGDDDVKAFILGLFLVQLYEYRKSQISVGSKNLQHILMIEEAHRLLQNVSYTGEGNNSRAKSVEFFCNMLAEIRSFGQGIFIADQIPTKLASDTLKNTNLKIVHRTVSKDDKDAIGNTMSMNEDQMNFLSSLETGYAAVYSEGDNKPKCVKFPMVQLKYNYSRQAVINDSNKKAKVLYGEEIPKKHIGCSYCEKRCLFYNRIKQYLNGYDMDKLVELLQKYEYSSKCIDLVLRRFNVKTDDDIYIRMCILGSILNSSKKLSDAYKQEILITYLKENFKNCK